MRRIDFSRLWPRAALALAALLASALQPLQAQTDPAANFPNKPIRMIVPFAAGGGNDIFARLVGAKASEFLGQQFVIENRPAAGGRIAAEFVANQPGDGYTIFVGASGVMSISAAVALSSHISDSGNSKAASQPARAPSWRRKYRQKIPTVPNAASADGNRAAHSVTPPAGQLRSAMAAYMPGGLVSNGSP